MAQVVVSSRAARELEAAYDWYAETRSEAAAQAVRAKLKAAILGLADFPYRGRPAATGERELVTEPPYVIRYRMTGETVTIERVRHGARKPLK